MTSPSYRWTTSFTTPAVLANLVITPDTDFAALVATVDASSDTYHEAYLWETPDEDGNWIEAGLTDDPEFTYRLAGHNVTTRLRVSDWNGAADQSGYSEPLESDATLTLLRWWLVHLAGDEEFTTELRHVLVGETVDDPLDQVVLQPLSGPDGELQLPIVITGQRQGERVTFSLHVKPDDRPLIRTLQRAQFLPPGSIALKDPKGNVWTIQFTGGFRRTSIVAGHVRVDVTAVRVA